MLNEQRVKGIEDLLIKAGLYGLNYTNNEKGIKEFLHYIKNEMQIDRNKIVFLNARYERKEKLLKYIELLFERNNICGMMVGNILQL